MTSTPDILNLSKASRQLILEETNDWMKNQGPQARVSWALKNLPDNHAVSSSFGVQSAVMLHLLIQEQPDIPVLLMDTGIYFRKPINLSTNLLIA